MTPREELVTILRTGLPAADYLVRDFNAELGAIRKTTVTVQCTNVASPLTFRTWATTLVVDVVAPGEDFEKAERVLEGALVDVLGVLRSSPAADVITGAERIVRNDRHQAWRITLTLPLKEA